MHAGIDNKYNLQEALLKVRSEDYSITASLKGGCEIPKANSWHRRLGHFSFNLLNRSVSLVKEINNFSQNQTKKTCNVVTSAKEAKG